VLGGQCHRRREQHAPIDALCVHQRHTWCAFEVLGPHGLGLVRLVGVARRHLAQHLLEGPGPVREVEAEPLLAVEPRDAGPGEDHFVAGRVAHRHERAVAELGGQVARERVAWLVAVGVAVEESGDVHGHGRLPVTVKST
jgi:hypothetical protein